MNVGFIGLGVMGGRMASNLQAAGHALVVHDVRREAAAPHLAAGAAWKDSPRAVAEAAEVVFTSLPGPPEVEQVALGPDGLLEGVRAGSVLFDLSTNAPALVRRLHGLFTARGAHVLDAPVSGGPVGARTRRLAIWVGGDRATFDLLADKFLPGDFEPPSFALRLGHKDVSLATALGREHGVPMRLANLALEEITEALNRGWGDRDSSSFMLLEEERAGVKIAVPRERLQQILEQDGR